MLVKLPMFHAKIVSSFYLGQCNLDPLAPHFYHYENTPKQHTVIFHDCKNDNFLLKFFDNFHIFAQT